MTEWIDYNVAQAMTMTVLHSLWQGAAIVALLFVLVRTGVLRSIEHKFFAHMAGIMVLLIAAVITFISAFEPSIATPEVYIPVLQLSTSHIAPELSATVGFDWHRFVTLAWAVGVCGFLGRIVLGWSGARCITRQSHVAAHHWQQRVKQLGKRLGVHHRVRLLSSHSAPVPFVFGVFRPVIVFPAIYFTQLTPAQLESILLHELAHIRRHDYLLNCIQMVAESLLFFNPATWWLGKQLRTYREYSCDDRVQKFMPQQKIYLEALYKVAEMTIDKPAPAISLFHNNSELIMRIKRMLNPSPQSTQMRPFLTTAIGLLVMAAFFVFNSGNVLVAQQKSSDTIPELDIDPILEESLLDIAPIMESVMTELETVMAELPDMSELTPVIESALASVEPALELAPLAAEMALEMNPIIADLELAIEPAFEIAPVIELAMLAVEPALEILPELELATIVTKALEMAPLATELSVLALEGVMSGDTVPETAKMKELQKQLEQKSLEMEKLAEQLEAQMEDNIQVEVAEIEALAEQLEALHEEHMAEFEEQMENSEWEQQLESLSDEMESIMEGMEEEIEASINEELLEQLEEQLEAKAEALESMDTIPPETREKVRSEMREIRAKMREEMAVHREKFSEMRNNPEIKRIREEMREVHRQMEPMQQRHRELMENEEIAALRDQLQEKQQQMQAKMKEVNSELRDQMRAKAQEMRELQRQLQEEMRKARQEKKGDR